MRVYVCAEEPQHQAPCLELFQFRFPKLKTLQIGPGDDIGLFHKKPHRQQFTEFLIAHPTIEDLNLDHWYSTYHDYAHFQLDTELLSPSVLPNIISLEAHPDQVTEFVKAGALFIRTMRKLVIGKREPSDIVPHIQSMFEAFGGYVDAIGPLQMLEFHLLLSRFKKDYQLNRAPLKPILEAVYDVFPGLETYIGDIAEMVRSNLASHVYPTLTLLDCCRKMQRYCAPG